MSKFKFIVHHDLDIQNSKYLKDETGKGELYKPLLSEYGIAGHAYAQLIIAGEVFVQGFHIDGYKPDHNRLERAKSYQASHPQDKILFSKDFDIDAESANKILAAMPSHNGTSNQVPLGIVVKSYNLFQHNCSDYVNSLFKLTGLPGLYSWYLTTIEQQQIPGLVRGYIFAKMGPGDMPQIVKGSSIEEVADQYNIDPSLVTKKGSTQNIPIMEVAMLQEVADILSYVIAPNPLLSFADADKGTREVKYPAIEEITESAKTEPEKNKEETTVSLDGNAAINELLSDPIKLAAYQQQSMSLAMQGIEEADQLIPGLGSRLLSAASTSQEQYGDLLSSIFPSESAMQNANKDAAAIADNSANMLSAIFEQVDLGDQVSSAATADDNNDWLNNLVPNTQSAMNEAYNNPDIQELLQTLGNNSECMFEDNA